MARYFTLVAAALATVGAGVLSLPAQTPMMDGSNATPAAAPSPVAPVPPARPMPDAVKAAQTPSPAVAPAPESDLQRYHKLLAPSDHPGYPYKLTLPAPGFGEVKIPDAPSLEMRDKLEQLATLSDAEIRGYLEKWPPYLKMSLGDQGAMLTRIQQFRDVRVKQAQAKAHQLGLLTLTPAQQTRFEQEYWSKALQMDHQLAKQFEPAFKAARQKLNEELFKEFSSPAELAKMGKPAAAPPAPAPVLKPSPPLNGAAK